MRKEINLPENKKRIVFGIRMMMLFGFMASAIMIVALPLYMRSIDFTETQIGIVVGFASFMSIFFSFVWGAVDNKYKHTQLLLRIIFAVLFVVALLFNVSKVFVLFVGVRMLYEVFYCGFVPLADKTAIQIEEYCGIPFNHIRVFGSIGYATILLPVLYFVDKFNNFQIIFFALAVCFLLALFATRYLNKIKILSALDAEDSEAHHSLGRNLYILFTNKSFLLLGVVYVLMFTASDVSGTFQGIHITETLQAANQMVSISIFISVGLSEVPLMFIASKIQKKIGWFKCVLVAALFYILRFVLEGSVTTWQLFMLVKLLHGFYISLFFAPILMLVRNTVPKSIYATAVSTLLALKGLSIAIVSPLIGSIIQHAGSTTPTYIVYTAMMVVAILFLFIYKKSLPKEVQAQIM